MSDKANFLDNFPHNFLDFDTFPPQILPAYLRNISQGVYPGLSAQGIDSTTTSRLRYGSNVFTSVIADVVATRLPDPVTGKQLDVVNNGDVGLSVYPSNTGGRINNVVDVPVIIPPDGLPYTFKCVSNPMPGAWTVSTPAIAQMNIAEMSVNHANGVADFGCGVGTWVSSAIGAGLDVSQDLLLQPISTYWITLQSHRFATKLKVYTNILAADLVSLSPIIVTRQQAYKSAVDFFYVGSRESVQLKSTGVVTPFGGAVSPGPVYNGNVGDAGTLYGYDDIWYQQHPGGDTTGMGTGQFSSFYNTFGVSIPANAATKLYKFKIFLEGY